MVSAETIQAAARSTDQTSSPRLSFSADFLDDSNFISITPNSDPKSTITLIPDSPKPPLPPIRVGGSHTAADQFEFLSSGASRTGHAKMLTADELFFDGKLLPFWQMQQSDRIGKISLNCKEEEASQVESKQPQTPTTAARGMNWFVDDDPSPRPPKCTVLWKELLRLKKQRPASSLSPSSSSSSTSSSSSSLGDIATAEEGKGGDRERKSNKLGSEGGNNKKGGNKKGGLERTRSATLRIRPMINVPICSQMKNAHTALPPFFPLKKGKV